ncbi:hypothetical protein YC2023_052510 [Brassica napus]
MAVASTFHVLQVLSSLTFVIDDSNILNRIESRTRGTKHCEKTKCGIRPLGKDIPTGSCECDRWRVRHSSSSKFSVASLEKSKASRTVAKFAVKHRRIMNSFERQNPRLLEKSLSESKAPRLNDFENKKAGLHIITGFTGLIVNPNWVKSI